MINGVHLLLYSQDAAADRAFIRDVLGWPSVEDHPGWLIFKTPVSELGVHPTDGPPHHGLYLMCEDLDAALARLTGRGVTVARDPADEGFGRIAYLEVPGLGELGLYEPSHPTPR